MTHGHSNRVPAESPVARAVARASGTWGGYQAWRQLEAEKRLELVDQALGRPANDLIDSYPAEL